MKCTTAAGGLTLTRRFGSRTSGVRRVGSARGVLGHELPKESKNRGTLAGQEREQIVLLASNERSQRAHRTPGTALLRTLRLPAWVRGSLAGDVDGLSQHRFDPRQHRLGQRPQLRRDIGMFATHLPPASHAGQTEGSGRKRS
ncbi:MAG: hypothetical protein WBQ44_09485, partial [Rhodococcus sp. (in: high G+C Gram-positive bacteria)]